MRAKRSNWCRTRTVAKRISFAKRWRYNFGSAGDQKQALQVAQDMLAGSQRGRRQARQFHTRKLLVQIYVSLGELEKANAEVRQIETLWRASHGWPGQVDMYRASFGSQLNRPKRSWPRRVAAMRKLRKLTAAVNR